MGKNTVQPEQWLDKYYPDSAPSRKMVEKCFADCKHNLTNTNGAGRSGHPNSAIVLENIKIVQKMVLADRKLKLGEIANTPHTFYVQQPVKLQIINNKL